MNFYENAKYEKSAEDYKSLRNYPACKELRYKSILFLQRLAGRPVVVMGPRLLPLEGVQLDLTHLLHIR